jgi:hypothetical protein
MPIAKSILLFCLKCATFSAIFWTMWIGIIRPITSGSQTNNSNNSTTQDAQTSAQIETYEKQVERSNRLLDVTEDQQKRTDQYITLQEESARRMDAILKEWEKQTGLRKK